MSKPRKYNKNWPSASSENRSRRDKAKRAQIRELELANPLDPVVVKYRESANRRSRNYRLKHPEESKIRDRAYKDKNRESINARSKARRDANPEHSKAVERKSHAKHRDKRNSESLKWVHEHPEYRKQYYQDHKDEYLLRSRRYNSERMANDPAYKIKKNLRVRLAHAVSDAKAGKASDTMTLLGCSLKHFMWYLERNFKPGMTFDNYGVKGWHIDHKKPIDFFDLTDPEQQRYCFHFSNLQPLWAKENLTKSNKFPLTARESARGLIFAH